MSLPAETGSDPEQASIAIDELPPAEPHPRRMLDRYEVIAQIAKGGMGTVYLARREGAGGFERLSAIKVLHEHLAEDDTFVTMLLDEARTAAHIHHPNAIGIDDVAESTVGHYLVMGYVDGFNLAQIVTEPSLGETDRIRICTRLIVDAANGLHAAHTAKSPKGEKLGIVHRDVSPQNVLVGTDGMGRIVDFGIALAASRVLASRPGTLKGKPQYMAPEQARGEPCDARTDVFALGVVLWETLTLERLFYGEMDVAILVQVMDCIVPDPRERNPRAPAALADVAMKALAKRPDDRYASARELAAAIERVGAASVASTAEVQDTIARVFGDEIALKAEAVRRHLDSSTLAAEPLQKGQLALIPRLLPKRLVPKRAELATRASGRSVEASSGVRARSGELDVPLAIAPTIATPAPSSSPKVVVEATTPAPRPPAAPGGGLGRSGIVLGALGILLLVAALGVWMTGLRASAPAPLASGAPAPDARGAAGDVVTAPAPAASAPAPTLAPAPSTVGLPPPPSAEPATPSHGHRAHAPRETPAATSATGGAAPPPPTPPPTPTPTPTGSMTIETNPYLTH